MTVDYSYMEAVAKPETTQFASASLDQLRQAAYRSAINTFGWPIAPVIFNSTLEPKPIAGGIEVKISEPGHRDYWTLKRSGEFYFLGELFENNRRPDFIFIDTRTNRIAETFLRIGQLYKLLGVPDNEMIFLMIKHGNIRGKTLGASNPGRIFPVPRICNENEVKSEFSLPLKEMLAPDTLKENVHRAVRDLAELFDMFNPDKTGFSDPIVDAFLQGKVI